jgi:hypothetical protein
VTLDRAIEGLLAEEVELGRMTLTRGTQPPRIAFATRTISDAVGVSTHVRNASAILRRSARSSATPCLEGQW